MGIADGGTRGAGEVDVKALAAFEHTVVVDGDDDGLGGLAWQEAQRTCAAGEVVGGTGRGAAIGKGVGHGGVLRGAAGLGDGKGQGACSFVDRDIVDRKARPVIVLGGGGVRVRAVITVDGAVVVNCAVVIGRAARAFGATDAVGVAQRCRVEAGREFEGLDAFEGAVIDGGHAHKKRSLACGQCDLVAAHIGPGHAAVFAPLVRAGIEVASGGVDVRQRQVNGRAGCQWVGQINGEGCA